MDTKDVSFFNRSPNVICIACFTSGFERGFMIVQWGGNVANSVLLGFKPARILPKNDHQHFQNANSIQVQYLFSIHHTLQWKEEMVAK